MVPAILIQFASELETKTAPVGNLFFSTTLLAVFKPAFLTATKTENVVPATAVVAPVAVTTRSAEGGGHVILVVRLAVVLLTRFVSVVVADTLANDVTFFGVQLTMTGTE